MARLPVPGGDQYRWGDILNNFLLVSHRADGTLKIADIVAQKYTKPAAGIPVSDLSADLQDIIHTLGQSDETTSGVISVAGRSGDVVLTAEDISSGVFAPTRIPNLTASKITDGVFDIARLPTGQTDTSVARGDHLHDDRYYTETEVDVLLNSKINSNDKGVAGGLATLDENGRLPTGQLPEQIASLESTLNDRDAINRIRSNHTGTQNISTIEGLQDALDNKIEASDLANYVTAGDLEAAVSGKADIVVDPIDESVYADGTIFLYTQ